MGQIDIARFFEMLVAVGAIFIPLWWSNRNQNRKQHIQNLRRFDYLINEAAERPHHSHQENSGPLTKEGIHYSPHKFEAED